MAHAKCEAIIRNKLGLHARPAMAFVDVASHYTCDIHVSKGKESVDGKSIMQMLLLAATQGTKLMIEANGADAKEACKALEALVRDRFDEE
jgi:phosphocarrier protein